MADDDGKGSDFLKKGSIADRARGILDEHLDDNLQIYRDQKKKILDYYDQEFTKFLEEKVTEAVKNLKSEVRLYVMPNQTMETTVADLGDFAGAATAINKATKITDGDIYWCLKKRLIVFIAGAVGPR